jgi:type II secretory pathway pseudopilin PulG
LLAVVLVILLLASVSLGVAKYVGNRANVAQTKALLAKLELAIESFRLDNGYYPTSTIYRSSSPLFHAEVVNSALLYTQLTSPKQYVTFTPTELAVTIPQLGAGGTNYIVDAWGVPIVYYRPATNVTDDISNQTIGYLYDTVPATNFFFAGLDNFAIGRLVNSASFDLFSYGPDKATYVPGSIWTGAGYNARGWPGGFTKTTSSIDDVFTQR